MQVKVALEIASGMLSHFNTRYEADFFAKSLLSDIVGSDTKKLFLQKDKILSDKELKFFLKGLTRGLQGEPVSKVLNKKGFWKYDFYVNQNVLDPRPDSETLIETALKHFSNNRNDELFILDLGTGSGCLLLCLLKELENSFGFGVDISDKALEVAQRNAELLEVSDRTVFTRGNWTNMICGKFDIILGNLPYIPTADIQTLDINVRHYDPLLALDGGIDGLDCYREVARNIRPLLKDENSILLLEVGIGQAADVVSIFENSKCKICSIIKDLNGIERCLKISL